ncbi:MAG: DEAD/DEAH box helicase, partial [Oscillospiraceae bacterium]
MLFSELLLREEIEKAVTELGYTEATEIQAAAIPPILEGLDVTGKSSTGTGKTAAFALPIIQMCADNAEKSSVLILSPTRELALQTAGEFRKFSKYLEGISVVTVYGGAPMNDQIRMLRTAKIVIGTPGRVMDHLRRRTLKLDNLKVLVLDEADEMLNMGFIDDIKTILLSAPEERQTVLFSATMPKAILDITSQFQKNPILVNIETGAKTALNIAQSFYNIPQAGKLDALKLLLEFHRPQRSLIFCNTKKMVDELTTALCESGFKAAGIHGDLKQSQRQTVMSEFKGGRCTILVATDVAARGIDVDDIEAVFNFDIPQEYEYYIHRIGRTARAGKKGASYTLVANRNQLSRVREIERYINAHIEEKPVPSIESIAVNRMELIKKQLRESVEDGVDSGWRSFIDELVEEGFDAADLAAVMCAAQSQKKDKRLVNVRNVASMGNTGNSSSGAKSRNSYVPGGKTWVRVNIGSDNKLAPNFIVGAIIEGASIPKSSIGKINIFSEYTDVELSKDDAKTVIETMQNTKIKGKLIRFAEVSSERQSGGRKQGGFDRGTPPRSSLSRRHSDAFES